jgi:hypothetical protein
MNAKPALIPNPNETGSLWLWANEPQLKTAAIRQLDVQSSLRAILVGLFVLIGVVSLVALIPHLHKAGPVPVVTEPVIAKNLDLAVAAPGLAEQKR